MTFSDFMITAIREQGGASKKKDLQAVNWAKILYEKKKWKQAFPYIDYQDLFHSTKINRGPTVSQIMFQMLKDRVLNKKDKAPSSQNLSLSGLK